MENLEEDLSDLQNSASPLEVETTVAHSSLDATLNDSVEIIETPIEVLDLTSPQPSTSSSSNSAGTATALVGATSSSSSCLVKRNLEEALKEERNTTDSTSLDQNPSTSNSSSAATTSSGSSSGNVLECPICLQTCIHPARLPCGHIFCFLCVKGVAYKNRRCAMCRREIPPEFLDHPQLVNGIEDICTTKATDDGYQWFYEGRNGGWWAYEKRNATEIEEAFQSLFNKRLNNRLPHKKMKKDNGEDEEGEEHSDGDDANIEVEVKEEDFDSEGEERNDDDDDNKKNVIESLTYDIQICGTMYTVDFQNMIQYPQAMPYRKRKICRAKGLPAKGVAGLVTSKKNRRMKPY